MKIFLNFLFILILILVSITANSEIPDNDADLILFNGKIITVDSVNKICSAIAIKEGKIIQTGEDLDIKSLAGPTCRFIDLEGKTVTPGLIDSHYHLMYYGAQFWPGFLDIRFPAAKSKEELLQLVGDRAKEIAKDEWIAGNQGFHLAINETVNRYDLDGVAPENPTYLRHSSGQYAVVNSRAMEIAGVDQNTPDPHSSIIVRDQFGEPTGILSHYPAENLVGQYAPGYGERTSEQKIEDIERGQQLCLEAGYTSVQDVIVGHYKDIEEYYNFAESGKLKVRVYAMLYMNTEDQVNNFAENYTPLNSGLFTFGGWKLAMDGGIGAKTVLMYDTDLYISEISYPYFDQETFNRMVNTLHNTNLQVAVHVAGDRGIDMVINAFENAMTNNPRPDPRHRIEHGLFPKADALTRMKNSNIILSTQPQWISWHADGYAEGSNEETMYIFLPLKTMLDMGVPLAFGCDVPASIFQEPKYAFIGSVFRRTASGNTYNADECLTIQEALRIHTMGSAYASFSEGVTGSLEPGKFADLVVWSHDLYTMLPVEYPDLKSEMTIVNGEIEYNSGLLSVTTSAKSLRMLDGFTLQQNYPNPFSNVTTIGFEVPVKMKVELTIFDSVGRKIKTLGDRFFEAGSHSFFWNGTNDSGQKINKGIYICVMKSDNFECRKKITYL